MRSIPQFAIVCFFTACFFSCNTENKIEENKFDEFVSTRYASFDSGVGAEIESGATDLDKLDAYALGIEAPTLASGRQERLENLLNEYL